MESNTEKEMQKHLKYLNTQDPFLMVLTTHAHVEWALRDMCLLVVPADTGKDLSRATFGRLITLARSLCLVSESERRALAELASLRNRLAHDWDAEPVVTEADVERLWKAFKMNPIPSCSDAADLLQQPRYRLMSVLSHIGADMREKQRVLRKLLPEIRTYQERLTLLHTEPGVIRQLTHEEWEFLG